MRLITWNVNGRYGASLPRQIAAVTDRGPDVVALQEVRLESVAAWRRGLAAAGLAHVRDSSAQLSTRAPVGKEYRRRYFNLIAARWPVRQLPGLAVAYPERYLAVRVGRPREAFEVHTAHLPPGSTRGLIKIEMFEALYARLARTGGNQRILCGDFNAFRLERPDGSVEFFGDRYSRRVRERWNAGERSVILGLAGHDLADVFRRLHGYVVDEASYVVGNARDGGRRRYDHIFASASLHGSACRYHHEWRELQRVSDHSALEADFA
jgi:exonuclease III